MEARLLRLARVALIPTLVFFCLAVQKASAARYATANFTVHAPSPQLARVIAETAEEWRRQLALDWLGEELPAWSQKCPITARVAPHLGAGGATSFVFDGGEVFDWRMEVQGSRERVLDSVVPHEVMHTIFASYFRRPLPRWADEGACTTVEHHSEISKQERNLITYLRTNKGIRFSDMFRIKEYPHDVGPLYAQGHSVSKFLIGQQGKRKFVGFIGDGMSTQHWPNAVKEHYGYESLLELQNAWMDWIMQGQPTFVQQDADQNPPTRLASAAPSTQPPTNISGNTPQQTIRGQDAGARLASASASSYERPAAMPNRNSDIARQPAHAATPITPTPETGLGRQGGSRQAAAAIDWPATNRPPTGSLSDARSFSGAQPSVYDARNNNGVFRR